MALAGLGSPDRREPQPMRRWLAPCALILAACTPSAPHAIRESRTADLGTIHSSSPPVETTVATTTTEAPTTTVPVTTTTEAPPTTVRPRPPTTAATTATTGTTAAVAAQQARSSGSGACGGDLPPCYVMNRESGGNPTAVSPPGFCVGGDGRCHGKWQFDLDTWHALGYSGNPENASEATQDEAARKNLARSGCGQWSTC